MRYSGDLKLGQLTKLFSMSKLSLMSCLDIFGHQEGIHFEFSSLNQFGYWKNHSNKFMGWPYTVRPTGDLNCFEAHAENG
jgi:hypothetical protein